MRETQTTGKQSKSALSLGRTVSPIPPQRKPPRGKLRTDLMRPPCQKPHSHQGMLPVGTKYPIPQTSFLDTPPHSVNHICLAPLTVIIQQIAKLTLALLGHAAQYRQIFLFHAPCGNSGR